ENVNFSGALPMESQRGCSTTLLSENGENPCFWRCSAKIGGDRASSRRRAARAVAGMLLGGCPRRHFSHDRTRNRGAIGPKKGIEYGSRREPVGQDRRDHTREAPRCTRRRAR